MTNKLCIYHKNCADGFASAWVVWKKFGDNCEYFPGVYGKSPPDVNGKDVYLVDFSYKAEVMVGMAREAKSITVIDHHKTAMDDLFAVDLNLWKNVDLNFNIKKSGARLTWEHFFPLEKIPTLIAHVEDHDLWKFDLPNTKEIIAALYSYKMDFNTYHFLMGIKTGKLVDEGIILVRKQKQDLDKFIPLTKRMVMIGGYYVPTVNLPPSMASDAGHRLCKGHAFAAIYFDTESGRTFSLRSDEDGINVGDFCKSRFGGGGHKHAAGFTVSRSDSLAKI